MADYVDTIVIGETEVPVYDTPSRQQVSISRNIVVPISSWVADTTYTLYPYKAFIAINDVTESHYPLVNFAEDDADSGNFCRYARSSSGGITIYSNSIQEHSITIPVITFYKEV